MSEVIGEPISNEEVIHILSYYNPGVEYKHTINNKIRRKYGNTWKTICHHNKDKYHCIQCFLEKQ